MLFLTGHTVEEASMKILTIPRGSPGHTGATGMGVGQGFPALNA